MVKQICPQCQHGNPLENRFCGHCGASLNTYQIVPRQETGLTVAGHNLPGHNLPGHNLPGHNLPAQQLKQIGQAAAVSLAALAAEVAIAWLRRRVGQMNASSLSAIQQEPSAVRPARTALVPARAGRSGKVVTVFSQRVVAVWQRGNLVWQMVDRTILRREE